MDSENYNFCFQVHVHAGRTVINEYIFFFYILKHTCTLCVYIYLHVQSISTGILHIQNITYM